MTNEQTPASNKAIATFILGLLSVFCFGFITGIPAIIIGLYEIKSIKNKIPSKKGNLLTKIGLVLGIIGTTVFIIAIIIGLIFVKLGTSVRF